MEQLATGNQSLPVLHLDAAASNSTFTYRNSNCGKRVLLLSTDDPQVVPQALQLCSVLRPWPWRPCPWNVIYTNVEQVANESWMKLGCKPGVGNLPARIETVVALTKLELVLEADSWVCTLTSTWCRLIDQLRITVAMICIATWPGRANAEANLHIILPIVISAGEPKNVRTTDRALIVRLLFSVVTTDRPAA